MENIQDPLKNNFKQNHNTLKNILDSKKKLNKKNFNL